LLLAEHELLNPFDATVKLVRKLEQRCFAALRYKCV
jgi:hypothetical protein